MPFKYPENLEKLIEMLKSLPGIGRRSAERMALAIYKWDDEKTKSLAQILSNLRQRVTKCPKCANFADDGGLCPICSAPNRDFSIVCVVEEASQIAGIENSGFFKGTYHVLGGKITPLKGQEAEALNIQPLAERIASGEVKELVLALGYDIEGQATAIYVANMFRDKNIKITRLAQGLPAGTDISYVDPATLAAAISGRKDM